MSRWKTLVYVAGREFTCRQSYDEIREVLDNAAWLMNAGTITTPKPIELKCKAEEGAARLLVQAHSISAVVDIEPDA